jgi:hypothetical protein
MLYDTLTAGFPASVFFRPSRHRGTVYPDALLHRGWWRGAAVGHASLFFIVLFYLTAPALAVLVKYEIFTAGGQLPFDHLGSRGSAPGAAF